jgi:hypothetical protein
MEPLPLCKWDFYIVCVVAAGFVLASVWPF